MAYKETIIYNISVTSNITLTCDALPRTHSLISLYQEVRALRVASSKVVVVGRSGDQSPLAEHQERLRGATEALEAASVRIQATRSSLDGEYEVRPQVELLILQILCPYLDIRIVLTSKPH